MQINYLFYLGSFLFVLTACNNPAKTQVDLNGKEPLVAASPLVTLALPQPVKPGEASPDTNKQPSGQFFVKLENQDAKLPDSANFSGVAQQVSAGSLQFKAQNGQILRLLYNIPSNARLVIAPNEIVSIDQKQEVKDASLNRRLTITGNKGIVIATGNQLGRTPIQLPLKTGLSLSQANYNRDSAASDSKYETYYTVPVDLVIDGRKTRLQPKQDLVFRQAGASYRLSILQSSYSVPKERYKSAAEGQGYVLQYLLLLVDQ